MQKAKSCECQASELQERANLEVELSKWENKSQKLLGENWQACCKQSD